MKKTFMLENEEKCLHDWVEVGEADGRVEVGEADGRVELGEADGWVELGEADGRVELGEADGWVELGSELGVKLGKVAVGICDNSNER